MSSGMPIGPTSTNVDAVRHLAPGTLVAGRYRILALAGFGGMGDVYKARDEELKVDVALKVLRPHLSNDPRFVERFRRELILARQVTHHNVVRIHDIGESDGMRFLTMSYVDGRSLLERLEREGPMPVDRAVAMVRQLADALQHAHDAGVIHRDLKPANILIADDGTAYVTDFGVARSTGAEGPTRPGAVVGTPAYLSPEQVTGEPVDHRADIYALGIVFYEMLTGSLPFSGESHEELLAQRVTGHVRDLTGPGLNVPRFVRSAVARCLARQPSRRYQQARDLVADLDRRAVRWNAIPGRRVTAAAAVLALVIAGVFAAARWQGPAAPAAATPAPVRAVHAVAVLPLADDTADESLAWVGTGLPEMIASQLAQSPELRVIDAQRVLRTVRDLGLAGARYDDRVLTQVAELLDVDTLLAGGVRRAGETIRLDLRLVTLGADGTPSSRHVSAQAASEDGLFAIVADVTERVRQQLGAPRPPQHGAGEGGTASMAAARAYTEGRRRLALGDYVGAAPLLEQAVAADATFAAALERLSETYRNLGYQDKALDAAERAARILESQTSRTALRVQGRLALLRGEPAAAETHFAELARRYPNDTEALLDLAGAQASRGEVARAVETLKQVTAIDQQDPRAWFLLGRNTVLMGDSRRAVNDYLVRALALQKQLRNEQGQGDALNAMGVAYHQLGDYPRALENYSESAAIRQRLGDDRGTATSLKNRARIYMAMSRSDEAEPDLRVARGIYERIGDRNGLADIMNDFGVLHERRGEYDEALRSYQDALGIRRSLGDQRLLAQSQDNVGYIYYVQGQYDNASVYWKEALALREAVGDKGGVIVSMQNIGFLQTVEGRWTDALKSFLDALERSREIDFKNAMAVSYGNVGILQHYQGRHAAALRSFEEALAILTDLGDKRGIAEFTMKHAAVLLDLGQLDDMRAKLDAAEPLVRATANREQLSDYHVLSAELAARRGRRAAARRDFERALGEAAASHSRPAVLRARIARSAAAAALGGPAPQEELVATLREAEALGDTLLQIRAAEALSRASLTRGLLPEAEKAARTALSLAERCGWDAGLYRLHALLGSVLEGQGHADAAAAAYAESARRIERLREGLQPAQRAAFDALPAVRLVNDR